MKRLKYVVIGLIIAIIIAGLSFITYHYVSKSKENASNEAVVNAETPKRLVMLISLDGMRSDLITEEDTPFLYSLLQQSNTTYTLDMQTLVQSETMPSHVSMVTGLTQEHHGFYLNAWDPTEPPLEIKTLFDYALEEDYSYYAFVTKNKLLYLLGTKTGDNIISQEEYSTDVLDDIDTLIDTNAQDVMVFIHLKDMDSYGHTYGWLSDEQIAASTTLDTNLGLLIADLRDEFSDYERYFIFTADHGGEDTQHSNGCPACRRIPLIVVSENMETEFKLDHDSYNIYDVTCVVLDLMEATKPEPLDCI
jgi:predicted AlkP superfamily pyrophosphatase or phosphodiesterase